MIAMIDFISATFSSVFSTKVEIWRTAAPDKLAPVVGALQDPSRESVRLGQLQDGRGVDIIHPI